MSTCPLFDVLCNGVPVRGLSVDIRIMPEKSPNEFKISVDSRQMEWGSSGRPAWHSRRHRIRVATARFRDVPVAMRRAVESTPTGPGHLLPRRAPAVTAQL